MDDEADSLPVGSRAVVSAADTSVSATTMVANSNYTNYTNASSVALSRNRGIESTRLLFMGNNFQHDRSDQDIFYDCEDFPMEGRSAGPSRCQLDDPAAIREALEKAANATQMLLKNFDKAGGWNHPCAVTLELTAKLVNPKKSRSGCPLHGKPVTVQMPLEFNPQSGKIASCQQRKIAPPKSRKGPVCQCRSQAPICSGPKQDGLMQAGPNLQAANSGKSYSEQFHPCESALAECTQSSTFVRSCGDSSSRSYARCSPDACRHRFDPEAREVISICYLPVPEPQSESEEEVSLLEERMVEEPILVEEPLPARFSSDSDIEYSSDSSPESSETMEREMREPEAGKQQAPKPQPEAVPTKRYYLALPQNKDFSNCSPCRFDPSPIMDEEGNVFCPGNCGCCMCPWMKRSLECNWEHINVKVCRCVQRGTIFTKFEDREICSQESYFDFCPCREKAEAKYLELFHREMWSQPDAIRGREIRLNEIKELLVPLRTSE